MRNRHLHLTIISYTKYSGPITNSTEKRIKPQNLNIWKCAKVICTMTGRQSCYSPYSVPTVDKSLINWQINSSEIPGLNFVYTPDVRFVYERLVTITYNWPMNPENENNVTWHLQYRHVHLTIISYTKYRWPTDNTWPCNLNSDRLSMKWGRGQVNHTWLIWSRCKEPIYQI